jgi:hypothetical protein
MRVRFSIETSALDRAKEYAKATHRTLSELIVESLEQIQARYPKGPKIDAVAEERIINRILAILSSRVQVGTLEKK